MDSIASNPAYWRLSTLLKLDTNQVHLLATRATGSITTFRVIVGRCLLALRESKGYRQLGFSNEIHYANAKLKMSVRVARSSRLVAEQLTKLPKLTRLAEDGGIPWTMLRMVASKATAETEAYWIELARTHTTDAIQDLVARTPTGSIPGEVDLEGEAYKSELRCKLSPEVFQLLALARRAFSKEKGEAVTNAEVLEWALASSLAMQPLDAESVAKVREVTDKDLLAEKARQLPLVMEARELAEEFGLLGDVEESEEEEDYLATAVGGRPVVDMTRAGHSCRDSEKFCGCTEAQQAQTGQNFQLEPTKITWQNKRLRFKPGRRSTTPAQTKEILRRDGWCCSTPGCPNTVWLEIHHLIPYSEGGPTTKRNLISLCTSCHKNLHDGLLVIEERNGRLIFTNANGERLDYQANLEFALWLDCWFGWRGKEDDRHWARALSGEWAVF